MSCATKSKKQSVKSNGSKSSWIAMAIGLAAVTSLGANAGCLDISKLSKASASAPTQSPIAASAQGANDIAKALELGESQQRIEAPTPDVLNFSALLNEDGEVAGWMSPDGTTYDAKGKLFAKIDEKGNVVGADGATLFSFDADCGAESTDEAAKLSWHWGWPPQIRLNRTETARVDAYGSLVVAPMCIAGAAIVSAVGSPVAGAAFAVACSIQTGAIIGVARYAVRHNRCEQLSVPGAVPTTWGC